MKIVIAILFVTILVSCAATKKSVSSSHQQLDSTATSSSEVMRSISLDSVVKTIDRSIFTKLTETGFQQMEIDSVYPPLRLLPNGGFVIKSPNKGKQILVLPTTTTAEKNANNIETDTHLQKKDTGSSAENKAVEVHVKKAAAATNKFTIGFSWWWLLLLLLVPFLSPQFRQKIIDQIKKLVP